MRAATNRCRVCNVPLSVYPAVNNGLCERLECRQTYFKRFADRTCQVCGEPLSGQRSTERLCAQADCRRRLSVVKSIEWRAQLRALVVAAAEQMRLESATSAGVKASGYPLIVIPSLPSAITPIPEQRVAAWREHLTQIIGRAFDPNDPEPPLEVNDGNASASTWHAVAGEACGLCRGHCCRAGGNHAYVGVNTIRRYRQDHPDQAPEEVEAAYFARLEENTMEGSCIYHGATGCGLPRSMRSQICNNHFCPALTEFLQTQRDNSRPQAFFASVDGDYIRAAAYIDVEATRVVRSEISPPSKSD